MSRLALLAAAAVLAAGAAHAQRVEVDPARTTSYQNPILTRPGELIASEISETDFRIGRDRRGDQFAFAGRAGQVVTVQVRSDIPSLEVVIMDSSFSKLLARGSAKDAPLRVTLPKDATYYMTVSSVGPQRFGKYLLSFGDGVSAPPFDPPKPPPAQVAEAPAPPAAPLKPPPLPVVPGVVNIADGQTVSRPAGKPGAGAEVFQFIAGAGSKLRASVTGAGPIVVTLYGPSGREIRTAEGMAILRLDASLPLDGLYFLSVARSDPTKPYKLALTTAE